MVAFQDPSEVQPPRMGYPEREESHERACCGRCDAVPQHPSPCTYLPNLLPPVVFDDEISGRRASPKGKDREHGQNDDVANL